ncbi:MAG: CoA transferase [Chloroflexota bacterium]|nr:MAG: CoA transferase [Chloroflexota bacterium]
MLRGYRVLDLTDEKGLLCGAILGDMGADVIKVERPGGDPCRSLGSFYHDVPHPEQSLFWFAYNTNKRGITLSLETADGRELFKKLARTADIVIESYRPGYLDGLGLGYEELRGVNPRLVLTSITAFGQTGPYKDLLAYDLQAQAMSGVVSMCGWPGEAPLAWSGFQAYLQASVHAAVGTTTALYHREVNGESQHVDVSIRDAALWLTAPTPWAIRWRELGVDAERLGARVRFFGPAQRNIFPCKDGFINWRVWVGQLGRGMGHLIEWMEEEGLAGDLKEAGDWTRMDVTQITQEQIEHWESIFAAFFVKHTKRELQERAARSNGILFPVSTMADALDNPQLEAREYFVEVEHPEIDATLKYPGAPFRSSQAPDHVKRRAPFIGEHNEEIYVGELGLTREDLLVLKQGHII